MNCLRCFGCCASTQGNDETSEFGILDGAGDMRGNFNELVLESNRMPRHVTGSVSVCGWEQSGCEVAEVDVIDWDETPSERSFRDKLALARQRATALQSVEEKTADDVSSTKFRQQLANIDKVEDMINDQIKKAAVMREQMQLTKARLKQRQDQMQEGQNGSRPDSPEDTRKEHKTLKEIEWDLDKMEKKLHADKRRLDEMRLEKQVQAVEWSLAQQIEKSKDHQKET